MIELTHEEILPMLKGKAYPKRDAYDLLSLLHLAKARIAKVKEDLDYLHDLLVLISFKVADRFNRERLERVAEYKKWRHSTTPEGVAQKVAAFKEMARTAPFIRKGEKGRLDIIWNHIVFFTEERRPNFAHRAGIKSVPAKNPKKQYSHYMRPIKTNDEGDYSMHMFRKEKASWVHTAGVEVELCLRQLRRARAALTAQKRNANSMDVRFENVLNKLNY